MVKVTGGHDTRVSLAALIAVRPGCRPRMIYRTRRARRADKRKGFTEQDYARFLDAAHQQLNGPVVLVWDNPNTHTSQAMRELIAAWDWLTVCPVRRGHRTCERLPERPETCVLLLITQRRLNCPPGAACVRASGPHDDLGVVCPSAGARWRLCCAVAETLTAARSGGGAIGHGMQGGAVRRP